MFKVESRRPRRAVLVASIACGVSLLAAVFSGVSWAIAANDDSVTFAAERDEVLRVGSQGIINFNTLDYRDVERGLDLWEKTSTGVLHQGIVQDRQKRAEEIKKAKTVTSAQVLDAAITSLDERAGQATMIAVVKVTATKEGQQPVQQRGRLEAQLTREGQEWKLSGLGPVSVG